MSQVWPYRAGADGSLLAEDTNVHVRDVSVVEADTFGVLPFGAGVTRKYKTWGYYVQARDTYHWIMILPSGGALLQTHRVPLDVLPASVLGVPRSGSVVVVGDLLSAGRWLGCIGGEE